MKRIIFYTLTLLLTAATLTACGTLPHKTSTSTEKESVQTHTEISTQAEDHTKTKQQLRSLLNSEDYTGAIELIQVKKHNGVDEKVWAKEYLQAANSCLYQADALMKQAHYSKAAILLKTVEDSSPQSPELQQQLAATPTQLKERIDTCTEKLMEAGLVAYRSGELTTAIDIWQQVLEFNPQHQTVHNSIQTTQRQLSKLKSLEINN